MSLTRTPAVGACRSSDARFDLMFRRPKFSEQSSARADLGEAEPLPLLGRRERLTFDSQTRLTRLGRTGFDQ